MSEDITTLNIQSATASKEKASAEGKEAEEILV